MNYKSGAACFVAAVVLMAASEPVWADPPCGSHTVEKTVMVPSWVTETKMVNCTEYRPEKRLRKVVTYKRVPEQREVTRKCVVLVPEKYTKTVNYTVCVPKTRQVTKRVQVQVPPIAKRRS